MNILLHVFNLVIDYYMVMYGKNSKIDKLFNDILKALKEEIELERKLNEINQTLETVDNLSNYGYICDD